MSLSITIFNEVTSGDNVLSETPAFPDMSEVIEFGERAAPVCWSENETEKHYLEMYVVKDMKNVAWLIVADTLERLSDGLTVTTNVRHNLNLGGSGVLNARLRNALVKDHGEGNVLVPEPEIEEMEYFDPEPPEQTVKESEFISESAGEASEQSDPRWRNPLRRGNDNNEE